MIQTVADFLDKLKQAEITKIQDLGIKHRPTIGQMYEGLTAELLNKALFTGLNLNIVTNSFIKLADGTRSDEFDIMLIEGNGKEILYSKNQYDVTYEQVIAIIQVKKSINKQQLTEAFYNLRNAYEILNLDEAPYSSYRLFRDSYISIFNKDLTVNNHRKNHFSSVTQEAIYHILKLESILPARIVFGYEGYKSEFSLREGFVKFLEDNRGQKGFSPINFPDLFINGDFSLLKCNGIPYNRKFADGKWHFYVSSPNKPINKLLEIIWTRLCYRFELSSSLFNDASEIEQFHAFLEGNMVNVNGKRQWNIIYAALSKEKLEEGQLSSIDWQPVHLSIQQASIMIYLSRFGEFRIDRISKIFTVDNQDQFIQEFVETGLVYIDKGRIKPLIDECQIITLPDGNFYAGDNKSGQLSRWLDKKLDRS